jgi:hypothetical protein
LTVGQATTMSAPTRPSGAPWGNGMAGAGFDQNVTKEKKKS